MTAERIVIGLDFSDAAVAAARWAAEQFAPGAELVLVHALDIPRPPSFIAGRFQPRDEILASAREGAERRLREFEASALTSSADRTRSIVLEGPAGRALSRAAAEQDATLIVVGEHGVGDHGHRRGVWGVLGTTADRLVRCSPVPVLVARGMHRGPPQRLLVPIDDSEVTPRVLEFAARLAERFDAEVIVLHALSPGLTGAVHGVSSDRKADSFRDEYLEQGERWLADRIEEAGLPAERTTARVVFGEPRFEIPAAQERYGADLVVMGGRGAGAIGRAILGSVAGAALRGTSCPVLVVTDGGCD
ncbi:MAG: universal stress protein [Gemmatimonadota bacterium]